MRTGALRIKIVFDYIIYIISTYVLIQQFDIEANVKYRRTVCLCKIALQVLYFVDQWWFGDCLICCIPHDYQTQQMPNHMDTSSAINILSAWI